MYFSRLYYVDEFRFRIPRLAKVFASMLEYVWQVGDIVLYRALAALPKLEREWRNKKWKTFLREFQEVLWRERDIGYEWNLDKEQVEILARYLTGHKFLLECLGQASVGNRVEIETRMLLPPHR